MDWVNDPDMLPSPGEEVLVWVVFGDGRVEFCGSWRDAEGEWAMGSAKNFKVTHWMYIDRPED